MNSVDTQKAKITAMQAATRLATGVFRYTMSSVIHPEKFYTSFLQHLSQDDSSDFDIRCAVLLEAVNAEIAIIQIYKQKYNESTVIDDVFAHVRKLHNLTQTSDF